MLYYSLESFVDELEKIAEEEKGFEPDRLGIPERIGAGALSTVGTGLLARATKRKVFPVLNWAATGLPGSLSDFANVRAAGILPGEGNVGMLLDALAGSRNSLATAGLLGAGAFMAGFGDPESKLQMAAGPALAVASRVPEVLDEVRTFSRGFKKIKGSLGPKELKALKRGMAGSVGIQSLKSLALVAPVLAVAGLRAKRGGKAEVKRIEG